MSENVCQSCHQELPDDATACDNCGAAVRQKSPLLRFTYFYMAGGLVLIVLYGYLVDTAAAKSLAASWLAVGIALLMIVFGRAKRRESDVAGLIYLVGLAILVILFVVGGYRVWDQGIALPEMRRLFD